MLKSPLLNVWIVIVSVFFDNSVMAQCGTWIGLPKQTEAEEAHTIYRQALKSNDLKIADEYWQIAYGIAPAADGKRDFHYMDGIEIYKKKLETETDPQVIQSHKDAILRLYDEAITCYKNKGIALKNSSEEAVNQQIGYLYGRKAYDMFYIINTSYSQNIEALDMSIEYAGQNAEYILFDPYARIMVWEWKQGTMAKEKIISVYEKLTDIAEYNIANNEDYSEGYQQAKAAMDYTISEIESEVFDCQFFKEKLLPEFEANPNDAQVLKTVIATLKKQGCPDTDPDIMKLDEEWKKYAAEENARILAEYEANNPAAAAKAAYDKGDFKEAIEKYNIAIDEETDNEKKAIMLFAVASIQFRKLNQYSIARSTAYEAAGLNPGWGRPYMLIGDMYGKTARSCGDSWNQRLAIIAAMDKYAYAKSIDGAVAGEANERIASYTRSLPDKDEGFMRGFTEGQAVSVGCWIGEKVKVRFK